MIDREREIEVENKRDVKIFVSKKKQSEEKKGSREGEGDIP